MKGVGVRGASDSREAAVRTGLFLLLPFPLLLAKLAELLAVTELVGVVRTETDKFGVRQLQNIIWEKEEDNLENLGGHNQVQVLKREIRGSEMINY